MAKNAVEVGVNANARDKDGRTALQRAARSAGFDSEIWNLLVENGGDPPIEDNEGLSVAEWAAILGSADIFSRVPDDLRERAAARNIHMAAIQGDVDRVRAFLDAGVSVNARHPRDNKTPLHWAAMLGNTEAVRLLIERGADVNAREDDGSTPLIKACMQRGRVYCVGRDVLELLVDGGADVNAQNKHGRTPSGWLRAQGVIE